MDTLKLVIFAALLIGLGASANHLINQAIPQPDGDVALSQPTKVDELFREPESMKVLCSDIPRYPQQNMYQVTCWSEPTMIGMWYAFEYVDGNAVPRSRSDYHTDSITIFLPTDPGPFILVVFDPADGSGQVRIDVPINAEHLKQGIQNLPGGPLAVI